MALPNLAGLKLHREEDTDGFLAAMKETYWPWKNEKEDLLGKLAMTDGYYSIDALLTSMLDTLDSDKPPEAYFAVVRGGRDYSSVPFGDQDALPHRFADTFCTGPMAQTDLCGHGHAALILTAPAMEKDGKVPAVAIGLGPKAGDMDFQAAKRQMFWGKDSNSNAVLSFPDRSVESAVKAFQWNKKYAERIEIVDKYRLSAKGIKLFQDTLNDFELQYDHPIKDSTVYRELRVEGDPTKRQKYSAVVGITKWWKEILKYGWELEEETQCAMFAKNQGGNRVSCPAGLASKCWNKIEDGHRLPGAEFLLAGLAGVLANAAYLMANPQVCDGAAPMLAASLDDAPVLERKRVSRGKSFT